MSRATPRLAGSLLVGVACVFIGAAVGRAEPVLVAVPFLGTGVAALLGPAAPRLRSHVRLSPDRVVEDEVVTLTVSLEASGRGRARLRINAPPDLLPLEDEAGDEEGAEAAVECRVGPVPIEVERRYRVSRWGAVPPVRIEFEVTDPSGMTRRRGSVSTTPLRSLPREETLRSIVMPRSLRTIPGLHLSRQRGDGIEFADTRPMVNGDRARDVNWRISARHGELWVDQRRPERSGEVVLFLDSFAAVGDRNDNTLRRSVEVAVALAHRHGEAGDRIGLVDLGGVLRWVRPADGTAHLRRVVESLIETELVASWAEKTADVLPVRALPRPALVVALTPLVDARAIGVIGTLRARGHDVAVIEVPPDSFVEPGPDRRRQLAFRLWDHDRDRLRDDLRARGIAVARWDPDDPLDATLAALGVFRRAAERTAR